MTGRSAVKHFDSCLDRFRIGIGHADRHPLFQRVDRHIVNFDLYIHRHFDMDGARSARQHLVEGAVHDRRQHFNRICRPGALGHLFGDPQESIVLLTLDFLHGPVAVHVGLR